MILLSVGDTLSHEIRSGKHKDNTVIVEVVEIEPSIDKEDEERYSIRTKVIESPELASYVGWREYMPYGNLLYHLKPDSLIYRPTELGQTMKLLYPKTEGLLVEVVQINDIALNFKVRALKCDKRHEDLGWRIGVTVSESWISPRFYLINEDGSPIRRETKTTTDVINPCSEIKLNFTPLPATHPYYTNTCPEWDEGQKRAFLRHLLGG